MPDPKNIRIEDYDYVLPLPKIAEFPLSERDQSKLLVFRNGSVSDTFRNIATHLPTGSLMVFNDSRVVEARLNFQKPTGAAIEIFCLEPDDRYADITTAFATPKEVHWKCLVGNASAWPQDLVLSKRIGDLVLSATQVERRSDHFSIHLSWNNNTLTFAELLHMAGAVPLPPYIKRKAVDTDAERYQTVYAEHAGSVAAPTAGLHFTEAVLNDIEKYNIRKKFVTLHVGAGTFKPVKSETLGAHEMHSEYIEVKRTLIEELANTTEPVVAVGTTSLRTLESLYWLGVRVMKDQSVSGIIEVDQWMPYDTGEQPTREKSLQALLECMKNANVDTLIAKTSLLIVPGYDFKLVSILVTNFHQPRSTLLLLIAAFIGEKWKSAYSYALDNGFRFLSYGDSCLLFRQEPSRE